MTLGTISTRVRTLPGPGEVHVWCFDNSALAPDHVERLAEALSPAERIAASGFRDPVLGQRAVAGRAMTLAALRSYVPEPDARIALARGPHGKPFIAAPEFG